MRVSSLFAISAALALSACASLEPEPCTVEWIEWKTDQVTEGFVREYRPELRQLAGFSRALEDPSPLVLLEMSNRLSDFQVLAEAFQVDVLPDLKNAVDQCGSPTGFLTAFGSILEDQGVSGTVLEWVEEAAILIDETEAARQDRS